MAGVERMLTEAKRSERYEASLTADGRYRLLVEAITDYAIYMLDPDGIVTSWNPGAQRFKGYEAARDHRPAFLPLLHRGGPRRRACRRRALETAAREGRFESEGWRVRKDGTPLLGACRHRSDPHAVGRADRLRQDHPRPDRAQSGRGGAAAKRGAVPAAGPGRHRLRASTCSIPNGRVTSWNAGAERIKGYTPRRDHRPAFLHASTPTRIATPACRRRALEIAAREGRFEKEGWRVRKDGTPVLGARRHRCRSATRTAS